LPKSCATGAQSFFEYDAMLGFGAPPVLGGSALQRFNDILGNVPHQKLRHDRLNNVISYDSVPGARCPEGASGVAAAWLKH
jgi:hypothetical protein